MKKILIAVGLAVAAVSQANAADMMALAKAKNCLACHAVDKKLVGPSYQDVAAKYAGKPGAEATLVNAVLHGVSGVWGPVPMPANPQVTPAEAKELVTWILSMKK
ncbi:Cytochrome c-551 [Thiomonas sp. X19]|uniref:c-type cytochrome n=1 Tax=Thiomonas sp. X19 TaxID=1050370 RepID=UPI000B73D87E|nr:c-type cytochrome [Thiomonas sp. X19]SCC93204.1 Cytochrome c-551 [Thiomonas sp. X19]